MTHSYAVRIALTDEVVVDGRLLVPPDAVGLVIFAHGSGSTHQSPRNRAVAEALHAAGFATLLFDLLTEREAEDASNRFDIALLADRLLAATEWARDRGDTADLPIGYYGASTGSAAALRAAAILRDRVFAVVSRGGRPDLVTLTELQQVTAPTMLIVGGDDTDGLRLNLHAYGQLACQKKLTIIHGATHLFEEPGALEEVTIRAIDWFNEHVPAFMRV